MDVSFKTYVDCTGVEPMAGLAAQPGALMPAGQPVGLLVTGARPLGTAGEYEARVATGVIPTAVRR